ncbi:MAG: cyclic nucleotide-binding domain-containing protein [Magnetococcales bacterium]|nr:cyclic nucleotide-binding domain-containing protein [Magnetococcales bacterium]
MPVMMKLLEKIPFFWEMTEAERAVFASSDSFFQVHKDGEVIIHENDTTDFSLYILIKGSVYIRNEDYPGKVITQLDEGAVIGEASFLASRPRTASVIAKGKVTVFRIDREAMRKFDYPLQIKIKDRLAEILVERLERMNHAMARILG